ncbi:alpha/beta fold hydrolase [Paraburkholderia susongensis]|uniref:Pimeloyl-ACP methyl ester carboxylesterase n=1 Tax=Paraburkholderia susongensis TaxID=1515439 RepID=A0A1X7M4R3_9BURK|nr:alpha/beta fold hydrolase [Paraburkholderia susongensis]SMG60513.1 Pimeloyl-ACP methyl ester carboxylesterase [Paraburkholderia susongensis]
MKREFFETDDGCRLAYVDAGRGVPFLWQHGLGADQSQPAEVLPPLEGIRRITLECRGHGESALGNVDAISIAQFADDAIALLDHLGIERAVLGGISLGAAVALRLAVTRRERAAALILARPAWTDEPAPARLRIYRDVAGLLEAHGASEGRRHLEASSRFREIERISPDNAASMRGFFERPDPASTIALLDRIPAQGPGVSRDDIGGLALPTLVVANDHDYVHPLETAVALAGWIPGAELRRITSKTVSRRQYVDEFGQTLSDFLTPMREHA